MPICLDCKEHCSVYESEEGYISDCCGALAVGEVEDCDIEEDEDEDSEAINKAISIFSDAMAKRMFRKASEGFTGWQQPQNFDIKERLLVKAAKLVIAGEEISTKDLLDIANFAMILYMPKWEKVFKE